MSKRDKILEYAATHEKFRAADVRYFHSWSNMANLTTLLKDMTDRGQLIRTIDGAGVYCYSLPKKVVE